MERFSLGWEETIGTAASAVTSVGTATARVGPYQEGKIDDATTMKRFHGTHEWETEPSDSGLGSCNGTRTNTTRDTMGSLAGGPIPPFQRAFVLYQFVMAYEESSRTVSPTRPMSVLCNTTMKRASQEKENDRVYMQTLSSATGC